MEHACNHFIIHASGYLITVHSNTQARMVTFDFAPEQYTYAYKDYNKNLKPGLEKSSLPLLCVIKPSPWWMTMPKLQVGHMVAVTGFLSHVLQKDDGKVQFLRLKLTRSISWERCLCWLVLINLLIPLRLFYSFFDYFPNFNFIGSHIDSCEVQRASVWFRSGNS